MKNHCIQNLQQISLFLQQIHPTQYKQPIPQLSNASIGGHTRHILEFYIALLDGLETGIVDYDARKRDMNIENFVRIAIATIEEINEKIAQINSSKNIKISFDFSIENQEKQWIDSSIYREMAFCLEHSIHHQALIKVATFTLEIDHLIDSNFGLAPATIRFQQTKNLTHA
jgi:hypothetical protein